ncbi:MAG TPA: hypothetical protein ENM97_00940 [Moorella mulderi]|nr:hypothetical protein [Moorella mulderi]
MVRRRKAPLALAVLALILFSLFLCLPAPAQAQVEAKPGILVVAHGAKDPKWCQPVQQMVEKLRGLFFCPVELAFLEEAEPNIIQGVEILNSQGVNRLIVVPLFISSHSNHIEEIKYILGLRGTPPDPEEKLERARPAGEVILTPAVDDHPLLATALLKAATPLLTHPDKEVLVLAAHGSDSPEGQKGWENNFASLADQLKILSGGKIKEVRYGFLFEKASPSLEEVLDQVIKKDGRKAVVIPVMVSEGYFTDRKIPAILQKFPQDKWVYPPAGQRSLLTLDRDIARIIVEWRAANELGPAPQIGEVKLNLDKAYALGKKWPCCALAWRVAGLALPRLFGSQVDPQDLRVISFLPPEAGSRPVMEAVSAEVRYIGRWKEVQPSSPVFFLTNRRTGQTLLVHARPELFGGDDFFALRNRVVAGQARPEDQAQLQRRLLSLLENLLTRTQDSFALVELEPLQVKVGQELRVLSYPELAWEEDKICVCRTFLYQGLKLALQRLGVEGAPVQGTFRVETKVGTPCAAELLEELAGKDNFQQLGPKRPPLPEDFYLKVVDQKGRSVTVKLDDRLLPEEFFALREKMKAKTATPEEALRFVNLRNSFILMLLTQPQVYLLEEEPSIRFLDIEGHWAEGVVKILAERGIISGYPDGTFRPEETLTRAEAASLLARALGLPPGDDSSLGYFLDKEEIPLWARGAVAACTREAQRLGYKVEELKYFRPFQATTRAELVVVLAYGAKAQGAVPVFPQIAFKDQGEIPSWAQEGVALGAEMGLISGYPDGTFRPEQPVTRAEAASMILRLLNLVEKATKAA